MIHVKTLFLVWFGSGLVSALAGVFGSQDVQAALPNWIQVVVQLGAFGFMVYMMGHKLPAVRESMAAEEFKKLSAVEDGRKEAVATFAKVMTDIAADRRVERSDFAANLKLLTDQARTEADSVRNNSREEAARVRGEARAERESMALLFREEQKESREFYAAQLERMQTLYQDTVSAIRTAVHDNRDIAAVAGNNAAVAAELARQQIASRAT